MKTLTMNFTYYITYIVARDLSFLINLSKQIYHGEHFLLSAHNKATNKLYGYVL